jgi:hypothetical protein
MFSACAAKPVVGDAWTSTDTLRAAARLPAMDGSRHSFLPPPPPQSDRASVGVLEKRPSILASAAAEEEEKARPRNASDVPSLQSEGLRDIFFGGSESSNADQNNEGDGDVSDLAHRNSTDTATTGAGTQDGSYATSSAGVSRAFVNDASGYSVGWMFDDESTSCVRCDAEFSTSRWRHHCRMCGVLVCGACSDFNLPVRGLRPGAHRVCADCFGSAASAPSLSKPTFLSSIRARGWSGGGNRAPPSPEKAPRPPSAPGTHLSPSGTPLQPSRQVILESAAESAILPAAES